jgi:hypothetical protein
MLQGLLADRFKLALHRQTKELSAYVVTIGKEGHKLKESTTEGPMDVKPTGMFRGTVVRADLDEIAALLSEPLQTPVINQTGLKGRYDFSADLAEYVTPELLNNKRPGPEVVQDMTAMAISAMQKQLGLNGGDESCRWRSRSSTTRKRRTENYATVFVYGIAEAPMIRAIAGVMLSAWTVWAQPRRRPGVAPSTGQARRNPLQAAA